MQKTQEMQFWSLGQEDPLEEGMATYSSVIVWRIPWREELDWLQCIGSQNVGHDWSDLTCTCAHTHTKHFNIYLKLINIVEHLFMCLLAICMSWKNVHAGLLPIFWLDWFLFLSTKLYELFYFGYWPFVGHIISKYFLPFHRLFSYFANGSLFCAKALKFK